MSQHSAASLVVLAPYYVKDIYSGPERFMTVPPLHNGLNYTVVSATWFEDDRQLNENYYKRLNTRRRLYTTARLLLSNWHTLRAAKVIYCLEGVYFEALMLLARMRLFNTKGKHIIRHIFKSTTLDSMRVRLAKAPSAFSVEVITQDQLAQFSTQHTDGRIQLRHWAIDMEWYHSRAVESPSTTTLLIPGNAYRDEQMASGLLALSPDTITVVRAGRSESLHRQYAYLLKKNLPFKLYVNASHEKYRDILHHTTTVLLPILPCDEPAGLTAAMEAIACGIPMLANYSMGIAELHATTEYPIPLVPDLKPETWLKAINELRLELEKPSLQQALVHSRELLAAKHSLSPERRDWCQLLYRYTTTAAA